MKRNDELRGHIADILRDWTLVEVLEAIAAEAAYWKRHDEKPDERKSWAQIRKMILKTVAVAKDLGL